MRIAYTGAQLTARVLLARIEFWNRLLCRFCGGYSEPPIFFVAGRFYDLSFIVSTVLDVVPHGRYGT